MAAVDMGAACNNPPPLFDNLDDLFDYDVSSDLLQEGKALKDVPDRFADESFRHAEKSKAGGLGIDEEIRVTKKRAPIAKLDETRLLSQAGIPKLRTTAKARLKFKGRGHEYTDVARLVNFYQLWLDDLYPRARFVDGLAMIEKLGHTKRMQAMRKEWITEGKPSDDHDDQESAFDTQGRNHHSTKSAQRFASDDDEGADDRIFKPRPAPSMAPQDSSEKAANDALFLSDDEDSNGVPSEDDLDALLAENSLQAKSAIQLPQHQDDDSRKEDDQFEDEMEAMAGLDEVW